MEIKISVLASDEILLNGTTAPLATVEQALEKADPAQDRVLYYRETSQAEPPPQAMEIMKLVAGKKLRFSFSSLPDFSDYVDRFGQSHPRPAHDEPGSIDPFAPRMPDVDLRQRPEDVFAKARQSASEESGAGGTVMVRPDRGVLVLPKLPPSTERTKLAAGLPAPIPEGRSSDIAVIVGTEFLMLHNAAPPSIEEAARGIPFLGLLMGWSYSGHRVWVFEGHPSALAEGLTGSDFLILDSGMLPFLQPDWMAVTQRSMNPGGKIFLYHREKKIFVPLAPSGSLPGWRFQEPDGEASYANCLLTTLAKGSTESVAIDSGGPVPD